MFINLIQSTSTFYYVGKIHMDITPTKQNVKKYLKVNTIQKIKIAEKKKQIQI